MNYKEIQVPSSAIREVFEPILEQLISVSAQAKEKYDLKIKRKLEWAKKEASRRDRAYKNYPRHWVHYAQGYNLKWEALYYTQNKVKNLIEICAVSLEAASLGEFLVMTEDQVREFTKHKEGKSLEEALEWLNNDKPYVEPESDYPEWMMTPPPAKSTVVKKEEPKPVEVVISEAPKPEEVESHFWQAFFVTGFFITLILVLVF